MYVDDMFLYVPKHLMTICKRDIATLILIKKKNETQNATPKEDSVCILSPITLFYQRFAVPPYC